MNEFKLIVMHPFCMSAKRCEVGAVVFLNAEDANVALGNGRAKLFNEQDAEALQRGIGEANARIVRSSPGYMPAGHNPRW